MPKRGRRGRGGRRGDGNAKQQSAPVPKQPQSVVHYNLLLHRALSQFRYNLYFRRYLFFRRRNHLAAISGTYPGAMGLPIANHRCIQMSNAFWFFLASQLTSYGKPHLTTHMLVTLLKHPRCSPKLPPASEVEITRNGVTCVTKDINTNVIALGTSAGKVILMNERGSISLPYPHKKGVRSVAFGHSMIASGGDDHVVRLYSYDMDLTISRCLLLADLNGHSSEVWSLAFSPFKPMLVSGCNEHVMKVWDLKDLSCSQTIEFPHSLDGDDDPNCLLTTKFNHDGDRVAVGCSDGSITNFCVCDARLSLVSRLQRFHNDKVTCLAWLSSTTIASSGWDGRIHISDVKDGIRLASFDASHNRIWVLELISPNCFLTAGNDGKAKVWKLGEGYVESAVVSQKKNWIYVSGAVCGDIFHLVSSNQNLETTPLILPRMVSTPLQPPRSYVLRNFTLVKIDDNFVIRVLKEGEPPAEAQATAKAEAKAESESKAAAEAKAATKACTIGDTKAVDDAEAHADDAEAHAADAKAADDAKAVVVADAKAAAEAKAADDAKAAAEVVADAIKYLGMNRSLLGFRLP